jgi:hypothetical protein
MYGDVAGEAGATRSPMPIAPKVPWLRPRDRKFLAFSFTIGKEQSGALRARDSALQGTNPRADLSDTRNRLIAAARS